MPLSEADSQCTAAAVVDLFCGAGGLSYGLRQEGLPVAAGIDLDTNCRYPFEENVQAPWLCRDIAALDGPTVAALFPRGTLKILVGCAPCQPFSPYNRNRHHAQWRLLLHFQSLIESVQPEIVSMENVPRLCSFRQGRLFHDFVTAFWTGLRSAPDPHPSGPDRVSSGCRGSALAYVWLGPVSHGGPMSSAPCRH